jgi:hypothetical protein
MGGGWSLDSPHAGMGCDQVAMAEIVLADGSVKVVSDTQNSDLFWAMRGGGGGNLGFVTKWWLRLTPVANVTVFSGTWRLKDNADGAFQALLRAIDAAPDRMGALISVARTAATVASPWPYQLKLVCQLHGTLDEFMAILGPSLAEADAAERAVCNFNDCSAQTLLELPYWDAQEFFAEHVLPNRYQETSLFTREISDKAVIELFRIWASWPGKVLGSHWAVYRTGGKVNTVAPDATAFPHRSSRWMITTDIDWSAGDSPQAIDTNLRWQRDVHTALNGMLGGLGSFYNFPDPGLKDHAKAYWGSNLARLAGIKRQVDPQSVFTPPRNQGIVT